MRYLYISYNTDKNLKDTQYYETLERVKKERGITCNEKSLALTRVASWTSPDGSGCYLIDFQSGEKIDFIDTGFSTGFTSHIMRLIPAANRELRLKELLN
jgi:hypothetical protein